MQPGRYNLRIAYSAHETRARKVPVLVEAGGRKSTIELDQTAPLPAGEAFRSAGVIEVPGEGASEVAVTLSNTATDGFVIVDAIQLLELKE